MSQESTMIPRAVLACVIGVAYLVVVIFAGHGEAPIALVLVAGRDPEYLLPVATGWLGLSALFLSVVLHNRYWRVAGMTAAILLYVSWSLFLWISERRQATTATSLPLFATTVWYTWSLMMPGGKRSTGEGA